MNTQYLEKFYETDYIPFISEHFMKLNEFVCNKDAQVWSVWKKELQHAFRKVCTLQEEKQMQEIAYIQIVLLRTRILEQDDRLAIYAYGGQWYAGEEYHIGDLDISAFLKQFEGVYEDLQKKAGKYFGKVKKLDIKRLLLEEVTNLLPYLQYVFRSFREEICELDGYQEMQKGDLFQMQIGEFYELGAAILQVAKRKNEKLLRKRIRKDEILSGYDLSALNLDGCQFRGKDISDVDLSSCSVRNGSFKGCNGTGLYVSEARIIHSLFQHVILQESIWKRCDLRDNVFDSCVMYHGYKDADSRYPDSRAMRMEGCDLRGTRFIKCVMNGVDLTQTDLDGCSFESCALEDCRFGREQLVNIRLEKKDGIILV